MPNHQRPLVSGVCWVLAPRPYHAMTTAGPSAHRLPSPPEVASPNHPAASAARPDESRLRRRPSRSSTRCASSGGAGASEHVRLSYLPDQP